MNDFFERTLENIIMSNIDKMPSKGLDIFYENTINQACFINGIIDIFTWEEVDNILHCRIIELKKGEVDESAFWQILNYKKELFIHLINNFKHIKDVEIDLVLIGSSFRENICLVADYAEVKLYEYLYTIDGIRFKYSNINFSDNIVYKKHLQADPNEILENNSFTEILLNNAPKSKHIKEEEIDIFSDYTANKIHF